MFHTRIKICGITRPEDALVAAQLGADAIGLVFYAPSPRAVDLSRAAEICAAVAPFVTVVSLFVDEPVAEVERIITQLPIDLLQFHGAESADYCEQFGRPYMKAVRVKTADCIDSAVQEHPRARALLLDAWKDDVPGGTGERFDWTLAEREAAQPIVLAGGLNAGNVGQAIVQVKPGAVDVSGGVEVSPGVKDAGKIQQFIAAVRAADQQLNGASNEF